MLALAGIPGTLTAGLLGVALTGGLGVALPPAAGAAPASSAARARAALVPGATISTVAGGVGGPGPATGVSVAPCGVQNSKTPCGMTFAGGQLYLTDLGENGENSARSGDVIRAVSLATGTLTTPVGDGLSVFGGDPGDGRPPRPSWSFPPTSTRTRPAISSWPTARTDWSG